MGTRAKVIPAVSERTVTEVVITVTHDLINQPFQLVLTHITERPME